MEAAAAAAAPLSARASGWSWSRRSSARPSSRSTRRSSTSRCPRSRDDLGGGLAGQQWTANAYLVTLGSLLLIGGSLGDIFGERRVFALGVLLFGVTSLICALAPTIEILVARPGAAGRGRRAAHARRRWR